MLRPQFSIRTVLWLTLVAAVFLGWIAMGKRHEQQKLESDRQGVCAEAKYNLDWQMHLIDERKRLANLEKRLRE